MFILPFGLAFLFTNMILGQIKLSAIIGLSMFLLLFIVTLLAEEYVMARAKDILKEHKPDRGDIAKLLKSE